MGLWFRCGGSLAIMLAAILVLRGYEKHLSRRLSEYKGLAELVAYMAGMVEKYLAHGADLIRGFENEALEECGLLDAFRSCGSLAAAFDSCSDRMALSESERAELSSCFSGLGRGYMSAELSTLTGLSTKLFERARAEELEAEKNIKVARALILGGALVTVITVV